MVITTLIIRLIIVKRALGKMYSLDTLRERSCVGIVLGAKVLQNGHPSKMLEDRIHAAAEGYKRGIFKLLLVTGKSEDQQKEVQVMVRILQARGVPSENIIQDGSSHTTKQSFQRLSLFIKEKKCILITQRFHLPRSLFLAEEYGFSPLGLMADKQIYSRRFFMLVREFIATAKDFLMHR